MIAQRAPETAPRLPEPVRVIVRTAEAWADYMGALGMLLGALVACLTFVMGVPPFVAVFGALVLLLWRYRRWHLVRSRCQWYWPDSHGGHVAVDHGRNPVAASVADTTPWPWPTPDGR